MKRTLIFAAVLTMLAACSNEMELTETTAAKAEEKTVIDLGAMTYEGVMETLASKTELNNVEFKDGALTRTTSLTASDATDPEQSGQLVFNSAAADSVELAVTPSYVSVRITVDGEMYAYLAYADDAEQAQVEQVYTANLPVTRAGEPPVARVAGGTALKMNLTRMHNGMETGATLQGSFEQEIANGDATTRGFFSNLWKKVTSVFKPAPAPVVKTPTIDIYMMKEKGANPATHEMNWQANDAISSLKDVQSNVKFNVHIVNCDFKGSNNSVNDLPNFRSWVQNSSYRNTDGVFVLCRWGGWSNNVLGRGYVDDYNVNNDRKSYCISSTSAWNKYCVAHEIGHNLGAQHVTSKWYQYLFASDVMGEQIYMWSSSGKHKDSANRNRIKENLTLR